MAWTLLPTSFCGRIKVCFLIRVPELGHSPLTAMTLLQFVIYIISVLCKAWMLLFVCAFVTDLSLTATDPFDLTSGVGNDALNNANISGSAQTLVHILWQSHGTSHERLF